MRGQRELVGDAERVAGRSPEEYAGRAVELVVRESHPPPIVLI